jgi:mRNA interferase RelE/StbE
LTQARVRLTEEAREDLHDLDGAAQRIVAKGLVKLKTDPHLRGQPLGSRASGDLTTFRKLVVGNRTYRIVYRVEANNTVVVVWVIGKRADQEAYELAMARLRMHESATVRGLAQSLEEIWNDRPDESK